MAKRKRGQVDKHPVETANKKSDQEFIRNYLQPSTPGTSFPWAETWVHPQTGSVYHLTLSRSRRTSSADLDACLNLVAETSKGDYEKSSKGWDEAGKRMEMREKELRYILVKDGEGVLRGFISLMPTFEEGEPVIYCYEIHLQAELRGTGLGVILMNFLVTVAVNVPSVDKVMLTVFKSNTRAVEFYRKLGFVKDKISPEPRRLRFGKIKVPDYLIMSKVVDRSAVHSGRVRTGDRLVVQSLIPKLDT